MTKLLLVDTDILIDVANGDLDAIARLKSESKNLFLAISVITRGCLKSCFSYKLILDSAPLISSTDEQLN